MEIKLVIELSDKTVAFLTALAGGTPAVSSASTTGVTNKTVAKPSPAKVAPTPAAEAAAEEEAPEPEAKVVKMPAKPAPAKPAAKVPTPAPAKPAAATPAKPATPSPAKPAPAKPAPAKPAATAKPTAGQILAVPYEDQVDDEGKLAHLMAHVTKHTKNGKSSDVKALLAAYSVDRASELDPEWYDSFNEAISRYSAGESVADIFPDAE